MIAATCATARSSGTSAQPPSGSIQPQVLRHPQDVEAPPHLLGPFPRELLGGPRFGIGGAQLAPGRGDADHSLPGSSGQHHQSTGQIGLVVGVSPDPQDRAQAGYQVGVLENRVSLRHASQSTPPAGS